MTITVNLINIHYHHSYTFFSLVMRTFNIYFLSNFQIYNTILTIVTMLYIHHHISLPAVILV